MSSTIEFCWSQNIPQTERTPRERWFLGQFLPLVVALAGWLAASLPASAGLALSPAIVDFQPDQPPRSDIELFNDGSEKLYIVVEPSLIEAPGSDSERRIQSPDPQTLGLLTTPSRLILEPGQRKYLRIAMLRDADDEDRIYRVTVKPVVGEVGAPITGLKLLVGYDVLVIQRPKQLNTPIAATRVNGMLSLRNNGNTNVELFNGRQCDTQKLHCTDLPGRRLYAGTVWDVPIKSDLPVDYSMKVGGNVTVERY